MAEKKCDAVSDTEEDGERRKEGYSKDDGKEEDDKNKQGDG